MAVLLVFCLISTPQLRMIKNTPLNYGYICLIGADVIQIEPLD